jgi:hypothetical protein
MTKLVYKLVPKFLRKLTSLDVNVKDNSYCDLLSYKIVDSGTYPFTRLHWKTTYKSSRQWKLLNIVTCLRHAAIVETQKSVNTLRNNRGSGVYSVSFRAVGG